MNRLLASVDSDGNFISKFKKERKEIDEKIAKLFPKIEKFSNIKPHSTEEWKAFGNTLNEADDSLKAFLINEQYNIKDLTTYTQFLKDQNKIIDLQIIKTKALNTIKDLGINLSIAAASAFIAKGLELAVTAIDNYINRAEKLKETAEEAKSAINDIEANFSNLRSTTDNIKERYAELAQGVEHLGKVNQSRGKLTTEDYDEFLDLSNQLAVLFPQLTAGYDDNGNAILNLSGNVDTIVSSLDNLVSVQQKLANQEILEKMPDVWAGYAVSLDEYKKNIEEVRKEADTYKSILDTVSNTDNTALLTTHGSDSSNFESAIKTAFENTGVDYQSIDGLYNAHYEKNRGMKVWDSTTWDFTKLNDLQLEQLKNELGSLAAEYEDAAQIAKGKIEAANSEMSSYINTWLSGEWNFSKMSPDMQNVVKDILLNSDWVSQLPSDIAGDWDKVSNWLEQEFLFAINNIDDKEIQAALANAFIGDFTVETLQEVINQLLHTEGFDENNPLIIYLQAKSDNKNTLMNSVKAKLKDGEEQDISQLSNEDLDIASEKIAVNDGALLTWDELISKIEEYKASFNNLPDASDSPSTLSGILSSTLPDSETTYNDAINDFKSTVNTINSSLENADSLGAADLMELIQQFSDFDWASYGVTGEKGIGDISSALEHLKQQKLNDMVSSLTTLRSALSDDTSIQWIDNLIAGLKEISVNTDALKQSLDTIVDGFQSSVQTYYDYIGKIKDGTFTSSDLMNVMQLDGFMELYETTGDIEAALRQLSQNSLKEANDWLLSNTQNGSAYAAVLKEIADSAEFTASGIGSAADAISALQNTYNIIQDVSGEIAESGQISYGTLSTIMSQYPSMIDRVQAYLLDSTQENLTAVIDGLNTCYTVDQENYYNYLQNKLKFDSDFYHENIAAHVTPWINKLVADYGDDLGNYRSYIEAKQAMDAEYYQYKAQVEGSQYTYYLEQAERYQKQVDTYNAVQSKMKERLSNPPSLALNPDASALLSAREALEYRPNLDVEKAKELALYYSKMAENAKQQLDIASTSMNDYKVISDALDGVYQEALGSFQASSSANFKNLENNFAAEYNSSSLSSISESADDFAETFNWIETAIQRIEESIDRLSTTANSAYKTFSVRNKALISEISSVRSEIILQQQAYDRYMQQANAVGLSSAWTARVQNGAIDISTITDENLSDQISDYQDWYEKALACRDAVTDLNETLGDLYASAFDNVISEYDTIMSAIEHRQSMIEAAISQTEEKGYLVSTKYYQALMKTEQENLSQLQKEKTALTNALNTAVSSGAIAKSSEEWHDMVSQINDVTLAIEEADTAMIGYSNSIRDIEWEVFDLLQDRISNVADESDFLISLMSNDTLYDERGQLTDEGLSTMGLHGLDYNVYTAQAEQYARELQNVDKLLAKDPYSQDLIERREELLELQQEMILAAKDEKQAIADMVEEGIELELSSLKELIDTCTDALDAQKDLYDYQKNISEQTKNIASLQKQLSAYEGDISEETRAKVQQIRVSLEDAQEELAETQYDQYISDQKTLLDELYNEYELILNQRLDNVDALVSELIAQINSGASTISATLAEKSEAVGYTLSENMASIWNASTGTANQVLTTYDEHITNGISSAATTLNGTLTAINANIQSMLGQLNAAAGTATASVNASSNSTSGSGTSASKSATSSGKTAGSSAWGSWFAKKNDSFPKAQLNIQTSIVDRLKYFNFDSSFFARTRYFSAMGGAGTYTGSAAQNVWMLNQMKAHGYKNGVYNLSRDAFAWTQEGRKTEAIIRPADGAILTPLARGDSVLKAAATSNLFQFANNPDQFIQNSLSDLPDMSAPQIQSIGDTTYEVAISIDKVQDYDDFISKMKSDRRFEKMLQSMTVDRAVGKSALRKYNI